MTSTPPDATPPTSACPVTAAVIALNETGHIGDCLAALGWANEVLVVDGGSRDATVAIAEAAGARLEQHPFDTFARQRTYALEQAAQPWVFFVDADERVSGDLAREVCAVVAAAGPLIAAAAVPRRNLMLGAWVRHGGWWPDHQVRLLRRGKARYDLARDPHEVVVTEGTVLLLRHPLVHHNYTSVGQLFRKQRAYARREARNLGGRLPLRSAVGGPAREFWRRLVTLEGYRDGPIGLLLALAMAWSRFEVWRYSRTGPAR